VRENDAEVVLMSDVREPARRRRRTFAGVLTAALLTGAVFAASALAAVPAVRTGAASSVTYDSAVVTGTVNPNGSATVVYFQYGTTDKYGAQSAPTEIPAGTRAVAVSVTLPSLTAATTYDYRIVATNSSGTSLGAGRTVSTAKIPLSLAITAAPNPVEVGGAVTIEGTLSGTGSANKVVVLQAEGFPYTSGFADVGNPELTLANGTFVFNVLGVALNTQYRVVSGAVASSAVVVSAAIGVSLQSRSVGTRRHPAIRFSGTISPAEPGSRVAIERLIGTSWKVVGGTVAAATANAAGVVTFAKTIRLHSGGFFRALALPVEGAHASGYSGPLLVRLH
jgi:hypothetical protein